MLTDRLFLVAVPDPTTEAIDRLFDIVDRGVEHVDRVLNRGKNVEEQHRVRHAKRSEIIDADSPQKTTKANKTTAVARKPRFYIVEAVGPSGTTHFVVTDGGDARTECTSREFAEKILRALEKA